MDKLNSLYYSTSKSNSRSSLALRKIWKFYDKDNVFKNLEYIHSTYNVSSLNKDTMIKEEKEYVMEKYLITCNDNIRQSETIKDINEWLDSNYDILKKSYDNCMKSFEIIKYLTSELGEYNYATTYEIGWGVKDFYKLYIDLYSTKITLNYKNKETILTEQKLKTFIQKNKKLLCQAKENEHKKYLQRLKERREQERIEKLREQTEKLQLNQDGHNHDATKKVGYTNKQNSFAVPRTLKQRYEAQACKPFPEKYPWIKTKKNN